MKRLIVEKLLGTSEARQFLTVAIAPRSVREKAFLRYNGMSVDVSRHHVVFCQVPFVVGVWVLKGVALPQGNAELRIADETGEALVTISIHRLNVVELIAGDIVLFTVGKSQYHFISRLRQRLVVAYFFLKRENHVSYKELDSFCATYLFPRKVVLVCSGEGDGDYNLFPMDLQILLEEENAVALGLRNTNVTLSKMLQAKRLIVCEVAATYKDHLYQLGRHHSTQPPRVNDLPFALKRTQNFGILVPEIVNSYLELEIVKHANLGSHTLMVARLVNKEVWQEQPSLYHVHSISAVKRNIKYDIV